MYRLRMFRWLSLTLILLTFCLQFQAQTPNIESLTISDGLSQGMIYDIEQTEDGFMWFATKDGLNRYDGYNFEVYTNDPFNPYSIGSNEVTALFEDSRGNLWIALMGQGFDVLEKSSGRFLHFPAMGDHPVNLNVYGFEESRDGTIWVGVQIGLLKFRWKNKSEVPAKNPDLLSSVAVEMASTGVKPGNTIFNSITSLSDSVLMVSIQGDGIYHYNTIKNIFSLLKKEDIAIQGRFLGNSSQGKIWISHTNNNDRVVLYDNDKIVGFSNWEHIPYPPAGILTDGRGSIYWSTRIKNETFVYTMPEAEALNASTNIRPILIARLNGQSPCMELDQSGNLWIGMSGYGLRKIKLSKQPFQHFLKGHSIRRILASDDIYLWMSATSAIGHLDESLNSVQPAAGLPPDVYQFYVTKNGSAYVIAIGGQHYYLKNSNEKLGKPRHYDFPTFEYSPITEDNAGNIWIGGHDARIMRFHLASEEISYIDLSQHLGNGSSVFALYFDALENLWIGTTNGIAQLKTSDLIKKNGQEINFANPIIYQTDPANSASLRYNFVSSFCDDPNKPNRFIWVSTKGGGLNLLDKTTGTFRHFTSDNSGLPNDVVYGILPDENGSLWMSTNRGLSRMTCLPSLYEEININSTTSTLDERSKGLVFQNFRETDGLQSDEFNTGAFYRHRDGRLMFGGVNGLTAFFPSDIKDRQSDAPVRITRLKINNTEATHFQENSPLTKPAPQTNQITLNYKQNLVTLEFALMDYGTPQENRYRYRLQGVDPEWVDAGVDHTANYANLRPGKYFFEVQGNIGYGDWSEPSSLSITVKPPWWASWWAYSLYALVFVAIVYGIIYFFKKRLRLQHQLKLKFEEATRLKDLDSFKSQLFTNLTHEFRTPLTVILGMTNQLEKGSWKSGIAEKDKEKVASSLKLIESNGKNLLHLINQLLDLSKLENNSFQLNLKQADIVPYLRYVTESFQSFANGNNLSLRFLTTSESLIMDFDAEQIKHVMINLISNALKFTPSGGDITVKLKEAEGSLVILVTDTGIGISPADLPLIFDRFFQVDSSSTRSAQGTGIGLAHAQELVKSMRGTISVDSEPGKGSSFNVTLPITNAAGIAEPKEEVELQPLSLQGLYQNEKMKEDMSFTDSIQEGPMPVILIIEDNPDVVLYLRSCLENDYQIIVAYNGGIGIAKAFEHIPDFIISDVMMPEKDGYQVCDALKNDERTSHIPIILLTAKADAASRMTGLRRGADAYLAKPFNVEELLLQITVLLENRRRIASYFSKVLLVQEVMPQHDPIITEAIEVEDGFITKMKSVIEAKYTDENFALPQLCLEIGMSRSQLFRKMKAVAKTSPSDLIRTYRLQKAKLLLQNGDTTVAEVTYQVGLKDPSYFSKMFQEEFGILPGSIGK